MTPPLVCPTAPRCTSRTSRCPTGQAAAIFRDSGGEAQGGEDTIGLDGFREVALQACGLPSCLGPVATSLVQYAFRLLVADREGEGVLLLIVRGGSEIS
jgi:hypothetical protein